MDLAWAVNHPHRETGYEWSVLAITDMRAATAARTTTFLGERYRRIARRRGKLRALVAVARSILVIVWHLLADPAARFHELGAGYPRQPHRQRPQEPQPRPPAGGTGLHRYPRPGRLTRASQTFRRHGAAANRAGDVTAPDQDHQGSRLRAAGLAMAFKLIESAQDHWRMLARAR